MTSGIEEDASDVFLHFFLQDLDLWFGRDRLVSFYSEIVTNLADQFLGIVEVNKGTRHDIWRLNQATGLLTNSQNDHENAFTRNVDTILHYGFMYWFIGIIVKLVADRDTTILADCLVW